MDRLIKLKELIDENNYPYFTDTYLLELLDKGGEVEDIAKDLLMIKAGIPEIKLGDVVIPSPRNHFLLLARGLRGGSRRKGGSRVMVREDGL